MERKGYLSIKAAAPWLLGGVCRTQTCARQPRQLLGGRRGGSEPVPHPVRLHPAFPEHGGVPTEFPGPVPHNSSFVLFSFGLFVFCGRFE